MKETKSYSGTRGPYRQFWAEFRKRAFCSFCDGTFFLYFIFAIVICGGFGVWVEVFKLLIVSPDNHNFDGIQNAAFVFYPALIGASCVLLALEATDKSEKPKTIFSLATIIITVIVSVVIGIFEHNDIHQPVSRFLTIFFSGFGLLIWCFANGNNPYLQTISPESASGGDTGKDLKGNTEGFQE